jgi:diketogulonate reductase-like aldo/keto reductase
MGRMKIEAGGQLDVLQLHWQEYQDRAYLDVLQHLSDIRREGQHEGGGGGGGGGIGGAPAKLKIGALGLVNFDSARVEEICEHLGAGEIASNQIQVSWFFWVWRTRIF